MKKIFRIFCLSSFLSTVIFSGFLFSDASAEEKAKGTKIASEKNETFKMNDIMVTAQKKEEKAMDVPITMTLFENADLEEKNIENIEDIGRYTPNLMMFGYGTESSVSPSMRGVFSDIMATTVPVGVYIDGVPVLDAFAMNENLQDIERVEVLKGPQGTLYGKNTEAGVINIITRQPDNEITARLRTEFAEDNKRQYKFDASTPIVKDKLFIGLSGSHYEKDGMLTDRNTGKEIDDRENNSGKIVLRFTPVDKIDISLINSAIKYDDKGQTMSALYQSKDDVSSDLDAYDESEIFNSSLKIRYQVSDKGSIESVSTRRQFNNKYAKDWDFTNSADRKYHVIFDDTYTTLAEELRYNQVFMNDRLEFLAGIYLDDMEHKSDYVRDTFMGKMPGRENYDGNSLGLFTHVKYGITDSLKVLSGIRYDEETKKFENLLTGLHKKDTYDAYSPKAGIEYDWKNNVMTYATVSKGYRAGGYNRNLPQGDSHLSFGEESLISYETGIKSSLFDNLIHVNASAYYMDIDDMQVTHSVSPVSEYIVSAAEAHSQGIEIETKANIARGMQIFASFGCNSTKFDKFKDDMGDYKNNTSPFAPEYNFNVGARYRTSQGYYARVDVNGYGEMYLDKENIFEKDAYQLVNTRLGYEAEYFDLYLYCNNLFDKNHDTEGYCKAYTVYEDPREIGIQLSCSL